MFPFTFYRRLTPPGGKSSPLDCVVTEWRESVCRRIGCTRLTTRPSTCRNRFDRHIQGVSAHHIARIIFFLVECRLSFVVVSSIEFFSRYFEVIPPSFKAILARLYRLFPCKVIYKDIKFYVIATKLHLATE